MRESEGAQQKLGRGKVNWHLPGGQKWACSWKMLNPNHPLEMLYSNAPRPLTQPWEQHGAPPPEHALTTVALITVVPTVIFKVALIGERNTGPRLLAPELSVGITDCGCYTGKEGTHYISSSHSPTNLPAEGPLKLQGGGL